MTQQDKIELLATLPVKDIDDLRLIVSMAFESPKWIETDVNDFCERWASLLNKALEFKQAQQLKRYDEEQTTFI